MARQGPKLFPYNSGGDEQNQAWQNPTSSQLLMKLDPRISPYRFNIIIKVIYNLKSYIILKSVSNCMLMLFLFTARIKSLSCIRGGIKARKLHNLLEN